MSATGDKGVEGAEPHARSQCGTLRGLAPAIYMTGASFFRAPFPSFVSWSFQIC